MLCYYAFPLNKHKLWQRWFAHDVIDNHLWWEKNGKVNVCTRCAWLSTNGSLYASTFIHDAWRPIHARGLFVLREKNWINIRYNICNAAKLLRRTYLLGIELIYKLLVMMTKLLWLCLLFMDQYEVQHLLVVLKQIMWLKCWLPFNIHTLLKKKITFQLKWKVLFCRKLEIAHNCKLERV